MRTINADDLMKLYESTPDLNIDNFSVPIPVIRQNIKDMPTITDTNSLQLPCEIGDIVYHISCGKVEKGEVICIRPFIFKDYTEFRGNINVTMTDPFYDDGRPMVQEQFVVFNKDTFLTIEEAEEALNIHNQKIALDNYHNHINLR